MRNPQAWREAVSSDHGVDSSVPKTSSPGALIEDPTFMSGDLQLPALVAPRDPAPYFDLHKYLYSHAHTYLHVTKNKS